MGKRRGIQTTYAMPTPDRVEIAKGRASALASKGKIDDALEVLSDELLKSPGRSDLLLSISKILLDAGKLEDAAETLEVLRVHVPQNGEVAKLLGNVYAQMRQLRRAIDELEAASLLLPDDGEILLRLAQCFEQKGDPDRAVGLLSKAVDRSPQDVDLVCYAASVFHHVGDQEGACEMLNRNSEIAGLPEVRLLSVMLMPIVNRSVEQILEVRERYRKTLEDLSHCDLKIQNPETRILATNFLLGYHGQKDRGLIELESRTLLHLCPQLGYISPHLQQSRVPNERIKVGFVSSNMRNHSVGRVLNRFLGELDRNSFETLLFELPGKYDGGQELARDLADQTVFLSSDLQTARDQIANERPDVLVFPDFVLEPRTDLLAFSRLAPVQCSTWGHPGTSGRPSIDYWISCEDWEPAGNEELYTEKLIRFKSPPMIATRLSPPENITTRERLGLPEGRIYGCPQSLYKLHPGFDSILANILERDPEGHVVIIGGTQPHWVTTFRERFEGNHPQVASRLIILDHLGTEDYLSLLSHCAVSLDPIEFGGANTSMEAFTMGLPVVTWPGSQLRNRQTYSFYRMMEFMDLVVDSREAYLDLALRIAHDGAYRSEISKILLDRCSVIFETVEVTRELEAFFKMAVANV